MTVSSPSSMCPSFHPRRVRCVINSESVRNPAATFINFSVGCSALFTVIHPSTDHSTFGSSYDPSAEQIFEDIIIAHQKPGKLKNLFRSLSNGDQPEVVQPKVARLDVDESKANDDDVVLRHRVTRRRTWNGKTNIHVPIKRRRPRSEGPRSSPISADKSKGLGADRSSKGSARSFGSQTSIDLETLVRERPTTNRKLVIEDPEKVPSSPKEINALRKKLIAKDLDPCFSGPESKRKANMKMLLQHPHKGFQFGIVLKNANEDYEPRMFQTKSKYLKSEILDQLLKLNEDVSFGESSWDYHDVL